MKWILALILIFILEGRTQAQRLSEKYHEKPVTQDTFLDKNHNGINDKLESQKGGKSLFEGIIEGINSRPKGEKPRFVPQRSLKDHEKPAKNLKTIPKKKKTRKKTSTRP